MLVTVLGSCVGVILYDKVKRIAGLAHVYLPESRLSLKRPPAADDKPLDLALKYADLLIPRLFEELRERGAEPRRILTYVVGGAMLFDFPDDSSLNVGLRNLEKTREALRALGLRFLEVKVGGRRGRKVNFNVATGDLEVQEYAENPLSRL
jgi:chemotaxis protein CheD